MVGLAVAMSLNFLHRDNHRSGVPWSTAGVDARVSGTAAGPEVVDIHTREQLGRAGAVWVARR